MGDPEGKRSWTNELKLMEPYFSSTQGRAFNSQHCLRKKWFALW
jgi:hypothetical protein